MATWAWILIVVAIVVVVALLAAMMMRQRRTTMLRQQFGPEYDRTMQERDDRGAAEADLRDRQRQRARLDIVPLAEPTRARFATEWREVQQRFVDQPSKAVVAADGLVYRVMAERGYPMEDFEAQAKLISVDHPTVVENYRFAHGVCDRAQTQQATTEDLRGALLRYRSLFDDLLQSDDIDGHSPTDDRVAHAADSGEDQAQPPQRGAR
jgi:FtsZ-interacting cell division protein ZipA